MKDLKTRIFSGIIALCMVTTMFPISASASNDTISFEEIDLENLEEMSEQITTNDEIQQIDKSKNDDYQHTNNPVDKEIRELQESKQGEDIPNTISETVVTYPVEGGNIYFDKATGTITDCDRSVTVAIIPSQINEVSVTSIEERAFSYCDSLTSVTIPDSVLSIGNSAFSPCEKLTNVDIGDSVELIGDYAFYENYSLTNVNIGNSVTSIGKTTFFNCDALTDVVIPDSVLSIGAMAFSSCDSLARVDLGDGVTSIGYAAFDSCNNLTDIVIPDSVISIEHSVFQNCSSLTNAIIGNGLTSISHGTFSNCFSLISVTIPDSVVSIEDYAFASCNNLTSVNMPDGLTSIGSKAFCDCSSLNNITIPGSITTFEDYVFYGCTSLTDVIIENGVTSIGERAFLECVNLTNITIPNSVTFIDGWAFMNCINLDNVIIPDSVTDISVGAFSGCSSLKNITMPNGLDEISSALFSDCTNLTTFKIPIGVRDIGPGAFDGCTNLNKLVIPDSVYNVDFNAFKNCINLTEITIPVQLYGSKAAGMFKDCNKINKIVITGKGILRSGMTITNPTIIEMQEGITWINSDAFKDCTGISDITIPNGVLGIRSGAFQGCSNLRQIIIPNSVTSIDSDAFSGCSSLSNIVIPDGVNRINDGTFSGCNTLSNIIIPNSVSEIGGSAFFNCSSLNNILIPDDVTSIGEQAFSGCSSLSNIVIPDGVNRINDGTFSGCNTLSNIIIPNSVSEIRDNAFYDCRSLDSVTIGNGVTFIGEGAFSSCDSLTDVYYSGSEADWNAITIGDYNDDLTYATIHYNSTDPDDPGTGSEISYVAGILKSYDPQEQKIYFEYYDGITNVYEYKITDQTVVEDWDILIGKPVLVSYIPGEYGTDTLSRYVITVQLAEPIIGNVDTITESTITLDGKVFDINLDSLIGLEYYIGETVACYVINDIIVDMKKLKKETGILNAGSNTSVTIDGVQYAAIFNGIPPYLPAPELWFEHEVEYYFYNDGVNQIIYKISLKSYSSTFTAKLTKWEGNTVTFEDDTIRQVAEDVAFDSTLIGKWVDYTVETTADGGNVISYIILAKPTYKTEVKKLVAWNDGNPQFSDGTTMGVFIIGDQYDPIMIGRWVKLTIKEDLNTGTRITGISLVKPSSKGDFKLLQSTDIYLKNNQYSFDGQNYEDSSKFEIEFKISIQNIVEGVKDTILSEMKTDANMNLTVEDIQVTEPNGFNFDWFGSGAVSDVKGLEIPAGEVREVTGFIRPGMWYFVDEKEVTEIIKCKITLTNGDVIEKDISFNIHNLDYKEPDQGNSDKELDQIIKDGIKDFEENDISSQIYLDINPMKDVFGISGKALDILECEILTAVIMSNAPENTKVEEFQDELMETVFGKYKTDVTYSSYIVPLYYVIKTEKYGELTVRFDCKVTSCSVTDSEVAIHAAISYEIIGQSSKAMLGVPPHLKANPALGQIAVTDGKSFCDAVYKVAEDAISDMYDDIWGDTANRAADILFDGCIKSILEAFDTSVSDITWQIITWQAKNITNACPTDVYIYDKNNVLCGSIINNVITLESNNFELSVKGDIKYIKGLTDDYTIKYVATDNGHMDVEIIEMMSYDKALRTVKFEDVKLVKEVEFTQDISVTMLEDTQSYNLESTTGEVVKADKDDILINFTPDDSEPVSVTSIAINKQNIKLSQIGATEQLTATITPTDATNKSVTWTSSNPSVATVDETGLVTALANGTATITVKTVDGGYTANCMVTVDIKSTSNNGGSNGSSSNSSGGGSVIPISYSVSIVDTDGGTITISPKAASKEKRVTITAVPDEGYKLDTLSVYDKNGNQIEFTKKTDIEYTFKMPASKVTVNAIFSKVIVSPEPSSMPFTDVPENAWYYDAIKYIYENNMMQGISDTEFAPNLSMNRAMIVTVLHRLENTPETTITNQFSDVESNQWYTEAVQWAFENDIVNGYSSDKFAPMDNVTREQLAVILYNYTNYKGGNTDIVGDLTAFQDADDISNWSENAISWAIGSGLLSGKGNGILDPKGNATRAEVAQILMNYCIKAAI